MDTTLYEQDYYLWLQKTAIALEDKKFTELDLPNLIEEIQSMGRSEKRAIESNLIIILLHLLKYEWQSEMRSNSWSYSIIEHRQRMQKYLLESPSLQPYSQKVFQECYQRARRLAAAETGFKINIFPSEPTYTIEQVLDIDYFPE